MIFSFLVYLILIDYILFGEKFTFLSLKLRRLHLWLQGYILGNPITKVSGILNYRVPFAYGMGLISDELYEVTYFFCLLPIDISEHCHLSHAFLQCKIIRDFLIDLYIYNAVLEG